MLFPYLDLATTFAQLAILVVYVISLFRFSNYIRPACLWLFMLFSYLDLATTFAQLAILVVYVISLFRFSDYIRPACHIGCLCYFLI